jgi:hypothetical protein
MAANGRRRTGTDLVPTATWQAVVVAEPRLSLVDQFKPYLGPAHRRRLSQGRHALSGDHRSRLHRQLRDRPQICRAVPQQTRPDLHDLSAFGMAHLHGERLTA